MESIKVCPWVGVCAKRFMKRRILRWRGGGAGMVFPIWVVGGVVAGSGTTLMSLTMAACIDHGPVNTHPPMNQIVPQPENLAKLVFLVRGEKVLLDADLADLYGVATKVLNQAVKRNLDRFPVDFMFQLTPEEWEGMRSQIVTSYPGSSPMRSQIVTASRRNVGALPYAFTEQGVAMLSSVLRSQRAVEVNIAIMRTFVQLRRLMDSNRDLARRIEAMETRYDEQFSQVFDAIKQLIAEDKTRKAKRPIGFL
ncbi:MAG: ORF6N domain-containing protein [Rhodoferax sp.]|uniref:ORF6N domain-containing protein n=1 Tax=Rhodoferax sp. TaxID=50421 RepID=UPI002736F6CF|nr:ORF6N domain-containing protein [Rhodoferax sp.]MDP2680141.1 ORF6N domain-containing protein [Rhodoferax sp.]